MAFNSTIFIDLEAETFRFFGSDGQSANFRTSNKQVHFTGFDEDFFKEYGTFLSETVRANPPVMQGSITVVLPDSAVFTDIMTLPVSRGLLKSNTNLNASLAGIFPNLKELTVRSYTAVSNKTTAITCLYGVQNKILADFRTAHQSRKIPLNAVTFASGATWDALMKLGPKYKGGTYLFLDIKETRARFLTVYKGRLVGSFELPFGFSILSSDKVESENMLFDHDIAELEVLNAKEKAKAKALTVMNNTSEESEEGEGEGGETEDFLQNNATPGTPAPEVKAMKVLPKKMPRKLPKFMTREVEDTPEAIAYENFRFFMKWSLDLLQTNIQPGVAGEWNNVYVNFPGKFDFLLKKANEEQKDVSPVVFHSAELGKEKEAVTRNLELYGGLFAKKVSGAPNL